ncbi:CBS domain-containing protein [Methanobrevibacter sp. DSM 116169]|uniref:CBS domain-containing protein n=1 Tax=Methanobrevibacter sp. DSM 116169 TaxID=3242727 RepID=UPI0038FC1745
MKDKNAINLRKSRNRGSVEHQTKIQENDGDIMTLASKDVVSIPPSKSIKETAETMAKYNYRRLPVTDPGSGKLLGIVTVMDILDFLGGGQKFNIIQIKYKDNFLAAINEPVREIMTRDVIYISKKDSISKALNIMLDNKVGAIPILDSDEKIAGIVTERDFALSLAGVLTEELAEDYMTKDVITTTPGTPIEGASKIMVRNKLRRIPIIGEDIEIATTSKDKLLGIVTATDILKFLNDKELFSKMTSNTGSDVLNSKISEIMATSITSVDPKTRLGDICEIFQDNVIAGVPVIKNDELVGIITERDILKAIED